MVGNNVSFDQMNQSTDVNTPQESYAALTGNLFALESVNPQVWRHRLFRQQTDVIWHFEFS